MYHRSQRHCSQCISWTEKMFFFHTKPLWLSHFTVFIWEIMPIFWLEMTFN